jgi:hypothetical protein
MGVPLYIITCVPQNTQKVKQNNLNNFTYTKSQSSEESHIPQSTEFIEQ